MATPPAMLVLFDADGPGRQYRLEGGGDIGRDRECRVQILDASISKRHARISFDAGAYHVADLGSRNGSFVNGRRVTAPEALHPNDVVRLGVCQLFFNPDFILLPDARSEKLVMVQEDSPTAPGLGGNVRPGSAGLDGLPPELREELLASLAADRPLGPMFAALGRHLPFEAAAVLAASEDKLGEAVWVHSPCRSIRISRSLSELALSKGGGIRLDDASADPLQRLSPSVAQGKLRSVMVAPLPFLGRKWGVAFLTRDEPGAFQDSHLELLLGAGPLIAVAAERESRAAQSLVGTDAAPMQPEEILGNSPAMKRLREDLKEAAASGKPVLILGETGTGKELVARWLHALGPNPRGPFVAVNCGAIPETLAQAELFGHERGAFTGADRIRHGKLEQAAGGTLFLDEIGDLPPPIQVMLLRALEEGTFCRVGGVADVTARFRLVSATNRDLDELCAEDRFRQDLFFRIVTERLEVPPLRDRREDVRVLAERFLERFARESGRKVRRMEPAALEILQAHHWPGNVRELRHVMERAIVHAKEAAIGPADLPANLGKRPSDPAAGEGSLNLAVRTAALTRDLVLEALRVTHGNKSAAARLLDIGRPRLDRLMKDLGIADPEA